jgi:hypothetical protein
MEPRGLAIFIKLDIFHRFSYGNPLSGNICWLLHSSSYSVPFKMQQVPLIPPKTGQYLTPSAILPRSLPGSPLPGKAERGQASQHVALFSGPRSC